METLLMIFEEEIDDHNVSIEEIEGVLKDTSEQDIELMLTNFSLRMEFTDKIKLKNRDKRIDNLLDE
jgi:hypothetical protein